MENPKQGRLSRTLRSLAFASIAALPGLAYSQENDSTINCAENDTRAECQKSDIDEITVTGSRIKRDTFTSNSPVTVINTEREALSGLIDSTDILQSSSVAPGQQLDDSFSGFVTDGGAGANSISLRGLGANRTLVLVNGRRWGYSGVGGSVSAVDLTAIPSSIVDRYEILNDGASSVYGADAVAGVVNVITKKRQDGLQINVQGVQPDENGGEGYSIDGIWGVIGDDWSFNIGADYRKQYELVAADRDYSKCDTAARTVDSDGDGVIDNTDPQTGEPLCFGFIYGLAVSGVGYTRYDPSLGPGADPSNPSYDPFIQGVLGIPYYTTADEGPLDNQGPFYNDTRTWDLQQIVPSAEIVSVTSYADKDLNFLGRDATVYAEFYYNQRETEATYGYHQFFPTVPSSNPTNPFGLYSPLAAYDLAAIPVVPTYNILDPYDTVDVKRSNTVLGIDGDINADWSYSAYISYGNSKGEYGGQRFLEDRVYAAVDATLDGSGKLVCRDLVNFPNCVAPNLFSEEAMLEGRISQDFINWASKRTKGETTYRNKQISAYATGRLLDLPAGEVQGVFGIERRTDYIDDTPDPETVADNIFNYSSSGVTVGEDTVQEAFTEIEVPVLSGLPFAQELLLNASFRYTDYDSYGSDTTHRYQLNWQVNDWLRLRASDGTSFRAPALYEQFLANQTGFRDSFGLDPCIDYGRNNSPGDPLYDNCAAQGLAPDFGTSGALPSIETVTGGNPNLESETSNSWTAGIVLTPPDWGFSFAVNWFEIELFNSIARPSVGYILSQCYRSENFSSPFCARVGPRDSSQSNVISTVDSSRVNVGSMLSKGQDFDFVYEHSFSTFDLTIDSKFTRIDEQSEELFDVTYDLEERWGYPEWTGRFRTKIDWRDWTFNWDVDYIGESSEEPVLVDLNNDGVAETPNSVYEANSAVYHAIGARYSSPSNWEAIATIRNVTDKQPPVVGSNVDSDSAGRVFNTLPGTGYNLMGRTLVLQFSKMF